MVSTNKPVNCFLGFDRKTFGVRLGDERKRLGFSQADVRLRTGVGKNAQINYEAGTTIPDAEYLWLLRGAGFDLMYVLTGERSPETPLNPELQNLLDAYAVAPLALRRAVFCALLSPYKDEWDKSRVVPGFFQHQILGEEDVRFEDHHAAQRGAVTEAARTDQRALTPDEATLLDNYRNSTPKHQETLRKTGAAFEKQVGKDDDNAQCA